MKAITNSQCDIYVAVLCGVYHDLVSAFTPHCEVARDVVEIHRRVQTEGIGFLTKTLPALGKSIDRSLALGTRLQFLGFKKAKGTGLPRFMWTAMSLLFSTEGDPLQAKLGVHQSRETSDGGANPLTGSNAGYYCREAAVKALRALRQVCYLLYKLDIPYNESQNEKVIDDFVKTDKNLPRIRLGELRGRTQEIAYVARALIGRVLCNADPKSGLPKHGPGAVATGETSCDKHAFKRIYARLNREYPVDYWFFLNANAHLYDFDRLQRMVPLKYGTAQVVLVPKDSRGPRLISKEPLEYQWIQQGQMSVLVDCIQKHRLTAGQVNFTSQAINRKLALEGSTGKYPWATLDMKEASDRVSLGLVYTLFPRNWFQALYASRSPRTRLPDGKIVRMKKFAPMGSAVCFPVEALVFWALSVAALMVHKDMRLREAAANVFVYGDDIITRSEDHGTIIPALESFGLMVNRDKCCTAGPFKESCGLEAYEGFVVTPLKLRKPWVSSQKASVLVSWVEFSNTAYEMGMVTVAEVVERFLQEIWSRRIPVISHRDPAVSCFVRPDQHVPLSEQPKVKWRFNRHLQRLEVQSIALRPTSTVAKGDGHSLMLQLILDLQRAAIDHDHSLAMRRARGQFDVEPTGQFPIAHREKPTRAWTPVW